MSWKVQIEVPVRFADIDSMGHVNNAKYFTYFEEARVAYFKNIESLDFTRIKEAPAESVILASIKCDFLSPAFLKEILVVKIRISQVKGKSFLMEYEIVDKKTNRRVAIGESTQVYFNYKTGKSQEIPDKLRKKFEEIEGMEFPKQSPSHL